MAKILTPEELAAIVEDLLVRPDKVGEFDSNDRYERFLEAIAMVVCDHCGGRVGHVHPPDFSVKEALKSGLNPNDATGHNAIRYTVGIHGNDNLPEGGGIWTHHGFDPEGDL